MSDYHFHYKREDRLKRASHKSPDKRSGSIFKKNRSLTIVLLDIVILVIVFGIWWWFLKTPTDSITIEDYRFELSAAADNESTYATLTVRNIGSDRSSALFHTTFLGENVEEQEDRDVLPIPGDVRVIRVQWESILEEVRLRVQWNEQEGEVRTSVR